MSLQGTFSPPGDKSISHRVVLFSLLAPGRMEVEGLPLGQDVQTSLRAVESLGGRVAAAKGRTLIQGPGPGTTDRISLDCGNSGTTMRLLMGLLAGRPGEYILDGDASLRRRPMERIAEPLRLMGAEISCTEGGCPIRITGRPLQGISYTLPVASAQLKSAVLLAGLQAQGMTRIKEPAPSRDHTENLIRDWGGYLKTDPDGMRMEPWALNPPSRIRIPGDISSAAFFLCAAAILPGSRVMAQGVLLNPTRTGFLKILERMGADLKIEIKGETPEPWGYITVCYRGPLSGCRVAPKEIPGLIDEVPILALAATQAQGETVFRNIRELRIKESDRAAALAGQLGSMGAKVKIQGDDLIVNGPTALKPAPGLDSLGDHRMAMCLRLALVLAGADRPSAETAIAGEECAAISYPGFREDLKRLLS